MSHWAAVVGLTYSGTDIQNIDGLFLEITQGLNDAPTVRGIDVTVPGRDGQIVRPRRFHERRLLLAGFVRGSGADDATQRIYYRANVRNMLTLFDATALPADLVASLEDGSTATISARTADVAAPPLIEGLFANVSIELLALSDWDYVEAGS